MELGYNLTMNMQQKMVMTQELMQSIQILQYSSQELASFIEEQMMANPVLEQEDNTDKKEKISREEAIVQYIGEYGGQKKSTIRYEEKDKASYENYIIFEKTLKEHLIEQLQFVCKTDEENKVGRFIIESLDQNGYMTISVPEIEEMLNKSEEKVLEVLQKIRQFEPVGVGCWDLSSCLKMQLKMLNLLDRKMDTILTCCMDDVANNRLGSIAKKLRVSISEVQEMVDVIKSLNPKPGAMFSDNKNTTYIVPDVKIIKNMEGDFVIEENESATPSLILSTYYQKLLEEAKSDESLKKYLSEKIESAVNIIKSIEQRKNTINNVAKVIVDYQKDFFEGGEKYLKPLTQKNIADELGIHESTVSRSVNGKYMESKRGVYEFKYFLSQGVSSSDGYNISSKSIKNQLLEIIGEEDSGRPYSDQNIVEIFRERNINLSRRTVAKYRCEMTIPSSSKRKRY